MGDDPKDLTDDEIIVKAFNFFTSLFEEHEDIAEELKNFFLEKQGEGLGFKKAKEETIEKLSEYDPVSEEDVALVKEASRREDEEDLNLTDEERYIEAGIDPERLE